ncbi:UNVERIFIED_CONTAM: hypothetical protein Slati_2938600 [Sesamum latifolium]|uniref:Gag/pol protein n=1 Tax=Sesamum latifolium TaxID=2727402 RepID=A0AAW2VER8_9LAMI
MSKNPLTAIIEANIFNGTNYNDWLRNLRIVLDFENQAYILDRSLPRALQEESTYEEHLTFEKWREDKRKVRSIVLGSMSNDIQKQYGRHDNVQSIMLRMSQIYTVPDRHIRYVATKTFFDTKMIEGSSVQEHGVKMLSLVEKFKDLKADLAKETYIDGRLRPQKRKGKGAGRWRRKKGKTESTTASAQSAPVAPLGMGKGKRKEVRQSWISKDVCINCREKGHWKRVYPKLLCNQGTICY